MTGEITVLVTYTGPNTGEQVLMDLIEETQPDQYLMRVTEAAAPDFVHTIVIPLGVNYVSGASIAALAVAWQRIKRNVEKQVPGSSLAGVGTTQATRWRCTGCGHLYYQFDDTAQHCSCGRPVLPEPKTE